MIKGVALPKSFDHGLGDIGTVNFLVLLVVVEIALILKVNMLLRNGRYGVTRLP
jgi:hypothetical protein